MRLMLALAIALAAPAAAQPDVVLDLPAEARAEQRGLFIGIVTTADFEAFGRAWIEGGAQLRSAVTQRAVRGHDLVTVILFQDCRPAADGKCNLTGRFTYLRPDGSEYGALDQDVWTEAPNSRGGVMVAFGPSLNVDPPDPMGRWTLRAEIRDNVRGVTVTVRTPILVDTPAAAASR